MLNAVRSFRQVECLVIPTDFQNTQMVAVIHRTPITIQCSLILALAAETNACSLLSFAQSILLRFVAQLLKGKEKYFVALG
jgi:hypothetical protein